MRLATWNVNGMRARLDFVLHWLRERQPDVVGLQELKSTEDQFPADAFEAAGYAAAIWPQKSWNGVGILARKPLEVLQRGLPGQEEMGARLISARIDDLVFTTLYVPNGKHTDHDDFPHKLAWLDALAAWLPDLHDPRRPGVLCGDFNVCPSPLDSWGGESFDGHVFHTVEERARFAAVLASCEWVDAYRHLHPEGRDHSWWDYRGGAFHRKQGLRIDLLLATPALIGRVRRVEIDREYRKKQDGLTASDHAPVLADID